MIKRRQILESTERIRRNKITQYLLNLQKCPQISINDRLLIREKIKQQHHSILRIFEDFKIHRKLTQLQLSLRRYVQMCRNQQKEYLLEDTSRLKSNSKNKIYTQTSQNGSYKSSSRCSPKKDKAYRRIINLDISQLKKRLKQSQSQSVENSPNLASTSKRKSSIKDIRAVSKSSLNNSCEKKQKLRRQQIKDRLPKSISTKLIQKHNQQQSIRSRQDQQKKSFNHQKIQNGQQRSIKEIKNVSYSSNIRHLLTTKLKKNHRQNNQQMGNKQTHQKVHVLTQTDSQTVLKRPAKPILRDQSIQKIKLFGQSIPHQDQATSFKQKESRKKTRLTSYTEIQEQPLFGQFYKKIRSIIEDGY